MASLLNNLGVAYNNLGDTKKAFQSYQKSLLYFKKLNDYQNISNCYTNIAAIYANQHKYDSSYIYEKKSLAINQKIKNRLGIAMSLHSLSNYFLVKKDLSNALQYSCESFKIGKELGFLDIIKRSTKNLYLIHKTNQNFKKALENYELYIQMRDSISNQETKKASIKSQLKYEYEKKAAADSVKVVEEKKLTTVKLKQEKTQRYFLYGGLGLTALFSIFMFNRFRITQKQKNVIEEQKTLVEHQKHLVDEKQKEILDSIHYAKRIQQSLLPTEKYINRIIKRT
jgi:tetratricopeptide (TPR) repeat protein